MTPMKEQIEARIMTTLRANPGLHLTDEFGEVRIAGTHFPLNEARAAITSLEAAGKITLIKDFARSRAWAITEAGKIEDAAPQLPQGLTDSQQQIITRAQQTGAPFSLRDLSATGLHFATLNDVDLPALLRLGLIERAPQQPDPLFVSFTLTPAGKMYAPPAAPESKASPAFMLARAIMLQAQEWRLLADQEVGNVQGEMGAGGDPELRAGYKARVEVLRACADDLDRVLKGETL